MENIVLNTTLGTLHFLFHYPSNIVSDKDDQESFKPIVSSSPSIIIGYQVNTCIDTEYSQEQIRFHPKFQWDMSFRWLYVLQWKI